MNIVIIIIILFCLVDLKIISIVIRSPSDGYFDRFKGIIYTEKVREQLFYVYFVIFFF